METLACTILGTAMAILAEISKKIDKATAATT